MFDVTDSRNEFFDARYIEVSESGCWVWTGTITEFGYGRLPPSLGGVRAHRYSFQRFNRVLKESEDVCHRCDVRCCVNPNHLWAGSRGDNNRDREAKGRGAQPHGSTHHKAKLSDQDVRTIFQSTKSQRQLAQEFGVTQRAVFAIKHRKSWARVTRDLTVQVNSARGGYPEKHVNK